MLAEETIQGGSLSAVRRSAGLGARRMVIAMALVVMAGIAVGPAAGVAAAEPLTNNSSPVVEGRGKVGESLVCGAGSWTGTGVSFEFEWLRNGIAIATGNPYKVTIEDKGSSISCLVIAKAADGETAEEESFNSIAIEGTRGTGPQNVELPKVSGTVAVGQTLTCEPGTWNGTSPIEYTYKWLRDGTPMEPIDTSEQYKVAKTDEGHQLACTVTATNTVGTGSATSRAVEVPTTKPPEDVTPPEVLGTPAVESELTCETGKWNNEPTFTFQWLRDGSKIVGATGQTYKVTSADETHTLSCEVTATNGAGKVPKVSSSASNKHIPGSAPEDKTPPTIKGTAEVGHTLTCEKGEWNGTAPINYKYSWVLDRHLGGEETLSQHEAHLQVEPSYRGHTVSCVVTAENSEGPASSESEPVIIPSGKAGAPENKQGEPPIIVPSGSVAVGRELECQSGGWTGNPESFSYQWLREPGEVTVANGEQKYVVKPADAGHTLRCRVFAKNSEGVTPALSGAVTVAGSGPKLVSPPKLIGKAAVNETLTCTQGEWTGSPEPTFEYRWVRDHGQPDQAEFLSPTKNSYVVTPGDEGHMLSCEVVATNSSGTEAAFGKEELRIPGALPENDEQEPPTIVGTPAVGEGLKCEHGQWTGTPTPTLTYQWLLEGGPIPSATQRVYVVTVADEGRVLSCAVTAKNTSGEVTAISKVVRVPGIKPQNSGSPEVTGAEVLGGQLKCEPGTWIGKPPPLFEYEWLRDGSSIGSRTSTPTYVIQQADLGHSLSCKVIAKNSEGTGEATSASVQIAGSQAKVEGNKVSSNTVTSDPPSQLVASAAAILAKLASQLTPMTHGAHIASLLKHGYYSFSFTSISAGKLLVDWYEVPKGAHVSSTKSKPKPILVATVTVSFTSASKKTVKLRLTSVGRSLLKAHRSIKLTAKGVFTTPGGRPVTWLKTFVLNH